MRVRRLPFDGAVPYMRAAMPIATFLRFAPALFVFIWSTGWIVAKYAVPHSDPLTFLVLRFAIAGLVIFAAVFAARLRQPTRPPEIGQLMLSGVLIHGVYLASVWWAIGKGVPAGLSALIAALQPLLAAMMSRSLGGERLNARRWTGVALGFLGIAIVIAPKLASVDVVAVGGLAVPLAVNALGMVGVTLGTYHQKRVLGAVDLRVLAAWQYVGALLFTLPLALLLEPLHVDWVPETFYALAWAVLVMSIGAIALLLLLIRHGSVAKTSALIYLVPPTAALQAYAMFGEALTPLQLLGMGVVAIGVFLATRG